MGGPARPLHEPGNHRSSERCSHRHSADRGSLIGEPTLLRITAPTPRPGSRSWEDAAAGTRVQAVAEATQHIWNVSWSRDGRILATAEADHKVRFRRIDSPDASPQAISFAGDTMGVSFAPDGVKFVAVGGRTAVVGESSFR